MILKVKRTRNREYKDAGGGVATAFIPAEYGVFEGAKCLARIIRSGEGWRACKATSGSSIGLAISPIGMNKFREVRAWIIADLAKPK